MILMIVAAVLSYLLGWLVYRLLIRWGVVDRPNTRSSHSSPTARGGGIAILVVLLPLTTWAVGTKEESIILLVLLGATAMLAVVSFTDDLWSLHAPVRFGFHVLAAGAVVFALGWPDSGFPATVGWPGAAGSWIGFLVSAVWIAGYTNAFNFMDGINGLAAGQAVVTGAGTALLGGLALSDFAAAPVLVSCVVAGAAAGFLPHNFPRARMFMGDVGSVTVGFLLASVALWLVHVGGRELLVPLLLLHANFVFDTGITLVRRILRGERFCQPHREHFYQRLVRAGRSHAFVTTIELILQAQVVVLLVVYLQSDAALKWYIGAAVVACWLAFFFYADMCFRGSQGVTVR